MSGPPRTEGVRRVEVPTRLLDLGPEVRVVVVQGESPFLDGDELKPPVGASLRVQGVIEGLTAASVVVVPELSLGRDLGPIEGALQASRWRVVVIAGLGFFSRSDARALGMTPAWSRGRANVAMAWSWDPASKRLDREWVVKNHFEQHVEQHLLSDRARGREILRLDFEDATLVPLVCADLIADLDGSPIYRLAADLLAAPAVGGRLLVVGCVWSHEPAHGLWRAALSRWLGLGARHVRLVLANPAGGGAGTADDDRFRRLSGVFWPRLDHAEERGCAPAARQVTGDNWVGRVARSLDPVVVAGPVHFETGSTAVGRTPWAPEHADGLDGSPSIDAWNQELARLIQRLGGPPAAWSPAQARAVALGLTGGPAAPPDPKWLDQPADDALERAAEALGRLLRAGRPSEVDSGVPVDVDGVGVAVWCDRDRRGSAMREAIDSWGTHHPGSRAVWFVEPRRGSVGSERRYTDPSRGHGRDISEPRGRRLRILELRTLEDADDAAAVRALVARAVDGSAEEVRP